MAASKMNKPTLYVFSISHYCEKARWALDFLDVDYQLRHLAPGVHISVAKRIGAKASSLPILVNGANVIQGSSNIIDWAENQSSHERNISPTTQAQLYQEFEQRLDDRLGVHARRYYYSEALVEHPDTVRPIFAENLSMMQNILLRGSWNVVRRKMIERMDLGSEQGLASKDMVEAELDWLDVKLGDGRSFLLGDRFTRVDITAASLLAPLVMPPEHPAYAKLAMPPRLSQDLSKWSERASFNWVRKIYQQYR